MIEVDKSLIRQRFSKSISTYNDNASVQKMIAKKLFKLIENLGTKKYNTVLELGCGTGMLTEQLLSNFNIAKYQSNDLVGQYLEILNLIASKYSSEFDFIEGDLEQTEKFTLNYDLISSASTLQWILGLDNLFDRLELKLNKDGVFAFSTFGPQNLIEIRTITNSGLYYTPFDKIKKLLEKRFELLHISEEICPIYFREPIDVLKHIKSTGVNAVIQTRFTKSDLLNFNKKYNDNYRSDLGLSLSYHPIYVVARKK